MNLQRHQWSHSSYLCDERQVTYSPLSPGIRGLEWELIGRSDKWVGGDVRDMRTSRDGGEADRPVHICTVLMLHEHNRLPQGVQVYPKAATGSTPELLFVRS